MMNPGGKASPGANHLPWEWSKPPQPLWWLSPARDWSEPTRHPKWTKLHYKAVLTSSDDHDMIHFSTSGIDLFNFYII